ncbi:tyrosine-type recombinase/integrase [Streptomyces canus]|uniref:tyrosine-type recombinase/integrase n=1 Tax=Streptomyces canus TaxID=58343 RepID=UPI002E295385|nr:tyrosine-type recombinase/integrase [Streptomyces canus]
MSAAADVQWKHVQTGLLMLASIDALRLSILWQFDYRTTHLRPLVERTRDPEGLTRLQEVVGPKRWASVGGGRARLALARIMLAKGGGLAEITAGDAFEYYVELRKLVRTQAGGTLFYSWLRDLGNVPSDAPVTLRFLNKVTGQLTCAQLVDRHGVACAPIRELLIDYLEERRPRLDYSALDNLARNLTRNFWSDLEMHHPGIDSLDLPSGVASAWRERFRTRIQRRKRPDGTVEETLVERAEYDQLLVAVRALYLDIARWAAEEPARWGRWAAPCPIKEAEVSNRKRVKRRKARMDQRTRERLPVLETFVRAAADHHAQQSARLQALLAVPPGASFTFGDAVFVRTKNATTAGARDEQGALRHFGQAEHRAFWAWAAVEFLRHTGVARIEEMLEISHHAMIQYRLPTTGEIVPQLQIAPSKTDQERVVLVSPELADVLATIIRRVRDPRTGAIPLLSAYDYEERVWNPPSPMLFQWDRGGERSRMSGEFIRTALGEVLAFIGLADSIGQPLVFAPHDFRRLFITDAIRSGLPPHITQVIAGHANINTTMPSAPASRLTSRRSSPATPTSTPRWAATRSTRKRPSKPIAPSSPGAVPCGRPRNTAPLPMPSGRTFSATSNVASSPSGPAPAPTAPPASTSTPASAAPFFAPIPPSAAVWSRSATISLTALLRQSRRAGWARLKDSVSA